MSFLTQNPNAARYQKLLARGLAKGASFIGVPFVVYRPVAGGDASQATVITTLNASFSGPSYNYNRAPKYDDVLWNTIVDPTLLLVGDLLVDPNSFTGAFTTEFSESSTYFIASMDPFLPIASVKCTTWISQSRPNSQLGPGGDAQAQPSQPGGTGHYWGRSPVVGTGSSTGPGEQALAQNVPVLAIANAGRATGDGKLPDDVPGPARWRFWLPAVICPQGSIKNSDVFTDVEGNRYEVSAAQWTAMGYRCECIRLEM